MNPTAVKNRTRTQEDAALLRRALASLPEPQARVALVMVSGLPGSGKSFFSRRLAGRAPLAVVESDAMRTALFPSPTHSGAESARLFRACHALIGDLLRDGISVLFDATNLIENFRERLYSIAERTGAKLVLVRVEAPEDVIAHRLAQREAGNGDSEDVSTAGLDVYKRMAKLTEPIRRNHYAVDTSREIAPVIGKVCRELDRWFRG
ncbi:MAG: ATP-binding protein [Chloroflexota bacterium]|nr:ATP-binding protein [Chloroflexota bacterium]MDE2940872.1 ATP-binding protein [Chloroflexota bacterium]MDE3268427.1 ATP-binding protein [Chloroflexota bacterium]